MTEQLHMNVHERLIETLKMIADLAEENTHSFQDGYFMIREWAQKAALHAAEDKGLSHDHGAPAVGATHRPGVETGREREDIMLTNYKLIRTGQAPIAFEGEKIASVGGRLQNGQEQNRWHTLTVYRTDGNNYVLQIQYHTLWQGEQHHDHVVVLSEDARDLADELERYDPLAHIQGYPPGTQYAEKQQRLLNSLTRRYQQQVSELLDKVPGAEDRIE